MDHREKRDKLILDLRRGGARLGWMGAIGVAFALLAAVEWLSVSLPAASAMQELEAQLLLQRESPRGGREIGAAADGDPGAQIAAFEKFFPAASDINRLVAEVHRVAEKEGLLLDKGEYKLGEEQGLNILRYQINLPVRGSYQSIRAFLRRALLEIPSLSLDGISLQRQSAGEDVLEARIRLSLFHQGGQ